MTAEVWLQVLAAVGTAAGAIWAVWAKLIPRLVESKLERMRAEGQLARDRAQHELEMEQTFVDNLVQSSITSQGDLTRINNQMAVHLMQVVDVQLAEVRKEIQQLRAVSMRSEGLFATMNIQVAHQDDSIQRMEKSMEVIKEFLRTWVQSQPVMRDPEEEAGPVEERAL